MPASGPTKPSTLSGITGTPHSSKRLGSPLALMAMPTHWPDKVASTRSRMVTPPISILALSPPPMRRARPPARIRPNVAGTGTSLIMHGRLAAVLGAFFLDKGEVLVEYDAALA